MGKNVTALLLFLAAFIYYGFLSAKEWTWMFVSGDSGAWIASAAIWMVPQPLGSPLYISLGHLVNLLPGDLAVNMTIWLSALPAAITVALVYLIVRKMTGRDKLAILVSGILLACGVFLSQATILEEYTLPSMFLALAFLFYVSNHRWRTVLALAAGAAVHSIVLLVAVLWLVMQYRERSLWIKPALVFVAIVALSYSMIPTLMALDTPRLLAGWLSLRGLIGYITDSAGSTVGTISVMDIPMRLLATGSILLLSYGLALVPAFIGTRMTIGALSTRMLVVAVGVTLWLSLASIDPTTWTFLCFSAPMVAILAAVGLNRLSGKHAGVVAVGVLFLLMANSMWLNASVLTREQPYATSFQKNVLELPQEAYVIVPMGGPHGLGVMKIALLDRTDIIPVFIGGYRGDGTVPPKWAGYLDWLHNKKGVEVVASRTEEGLVNFEEIVSWAVEHDKEVFWCIASEFPGYTDPWARSVPYNGSFAQVMEP